MRDAVAEVGLDVVGAVVVDDDEDDAGLDASKGFLDEAEEGFVGVEGLLLEEKAEEPPPEEE